MKLNDFKKLKKEELKEITELDLISEGKDISNEVLVWAIQTNYIEMVETLLTFDNVRANAHADGNRALQAAASNGHIEIVQMLLALDKVRDVDALQLAISKGHLDGDGLLILAADANYREIVEMLLKLDNVRANAHTDGNLALQLAVRNGHIKIVEMLLRLNNVKANAHAGNVFDGKTALQTAVGNGHIDIVKMLLRLENVKANFHHDDVHALQLAISKGYFDGKQLLSLAAEENYINIVEMLLTLDNVKATLHRDGVRALQLAASNGHTEIVKMLLALDKVKANAHVSNDLDGKTALELAASSGHIEIVRLLLQVENVRAKAHFGNGFDGKKAALELAASNGHTEIVKMLLELDNVRANAHVRNDFNGKKTTLELAVDNGHTKIVKVLLELDNVRANAHLNGNRALDSALRDDHIKIVQMLLKIDNVKAEAHVYNNAFLRLAISKGHVDIAEMLLKLGNVRDRIRLDGHHALQLLWLAASKGHTEIVKILLQLDNVKASAHLDDNRVLREAASNGHIEIVKLLLRLDNVKASIHHDDVHALQLAISKGHLDGNQLLSLAAEENYTEIVKMLLKLDNVRANAHVGNGFDGKTALELAASKGHTEIVKMLLKLEKVRDVDALQLAISKGHLDGNVLLVLAAEENYINIVEMLLKLDNVKAKAHVDGNRVLWTAAENNHKEVVECLLQLKNVQENIEIERFKNLTLSPEILKLLVLHLSLYGLPLKVVFNDTAIAKISEDPIGYLNIMSEVTELYDSFPNTVFYDSFSDEEKPFSLDKLVFLKILKGREEIKKAEARYRANSETAMAPEVLKSAAIAYQKAKDLYGKQLKEIGLEKVEQEIRKMLLEQLLERTDILTEAKNFIMVNKEKLILGQDKVLMDKARVYFASNTDIIEIAWRGYDPYAPVSGGWNNLLTPPLVDKPVFAAGVIEGGGGEISVSMASGDARERVALYYLALIDKDKTFKIDFPSRQAIFIGQLAEIRRAHNNLSGDDLKGDDPTCYPGLVGRVVSMGAGHPDLDIPDTIKLIAEFMREFLRETMQNMSQDKTDLEKEKFCFAIRVFTDLTIKALKEGKELAWELSTGMKVSIEELASLYQNILKSISNREENLLIKFNEALAKRDLNKKAFLQNEELYVIQQWLELTSNGVGPSVAEDFDPTKVSDLKKQLVFNQVYPILRSLLPEEGIEQACAYLLKKCIDLQLEPKDTIQGWKIEKSTLKEAYNQYLKTGYSKPILPLSSENIEQFLMQLDKALETGQTIPLKGYKEKLWQELEELESKMENITKMEQIQNLTDPFSVSGLHQSLEKLQSSKSINPVLLKANIKRLKAQIEAAENKNAYFRITYSALNTCLTDIKDKNILAFLAKELVEKNYANHSNSWEHTILGEELKKLYDDFKRTDGYQKIKEMEPENLEHFSKALTSACQDIAEQLKKKTGPSV